MRARRRDAGIVAAYKRIDTCAAEFESFTPYLYGTFEQECEADPTPRNKVVILGSGPNRIGQGIEFDYCCCHAAFALRDEGYETVMVNCNPETVSTDYDSVDRLYFEPLTFEDVIAIIEREKSAGGDVACVVQYGGQTPLKLALSLQAAGVQILGTSPDSIDLAEDRERFAKLLEDLEHPAGAERHGDVRRRKRATSRPASASRSSCARRTCSAAARWRSSTTRRRSIATCGTPCRRRPSIRSSSTSSSRTRPRSTSTRSPTRTGAVVIGGIMEHIEQAGIHSGDSSCVVPPLPAERAARRDDPRLHAPHRARA